MKQLNSSTVDDTLKSFKVAFSNIELDTNITKKITFSANGEPLSGRAAYLADSDIFKLSKAESNVFMYDDSGAPGVPSQINMKLTELDKITLHIPYTSFLNGSVDLEKTEFTNLSNELYALN